MSCKEEKSGKVFKNHKWRIWGWRQDSGGMWGYYACWFTHKCGRCGELARRGKAT